MADIQKELKQLEDSIPAILVSPCTSGIEVTEKIQEKSREVAKHILIKAIDLHHQGVDVTDSYESELDLELSSSESNLLFNANDLVIEVIVRALELNFTDARESDPGYENTTITSEAVMAIFHAVDPDKGMTSLQSQIFFRAKEMVHDTVGRAFVINSGIKAMNAALNKQGREESDKVMETVKEIVRKVITKSMKHFVDMMEGRSAKREVKTSMPSPVPKAEEKPRRSSLKKGMYSLKQELMKGSVQNGLWQ